MAIKIIKHGQKPKFTKVCPHCGCEFEYEFEDLRVESNLSLNTCSYPPYKKRVVVCPDCGEKLYHDSIVDPDWTYPNVIYTNTNGLGTADLDCDKCPNKPDFKNGKYVVGDTPCTWCPKMQPYCTVTSTSATYNYDGPTYTVNIEDKKKENNEPK